MEECEGGGTRKTSRTTKKKQREKGTTTVDGGEGDDEKEKEKGEKRTDEKMMSATAMERAYVKNFSADKFLVLHRWKSAQREKALKKRFSLGTFFEFAKEGLTRDTWKHLENEGKARSLIRTVPDKCPNKELYAEFVLLRLVEVCEVAQTTKKGWTDKGWAQCGSSWYQCLGATCAKANATSLF